MNLTIYFGALEYSLMLQLTARAAAFNPRQVYDPARRGYAVLRELPVSDAAARALRAMIELNHGAGLSYKLDGEQGYICLSPDNYGQWQLTLIPDEDEDDLPPPPEEFFQI